MLKKKRHKSKRYCKAVANLPCVITGGQAQCHHMIGHGVSGMGLKACDFDTMPLAPEIHDELHRHGYRDWEKKYGRQRLYVKRTQSILEDVLISEYTRLNK